MSAPIVQGCIGVRLQGLPPWATRYRGAPMYCIYFLWLFLFVLCGVLGPPVFETQVNGCTDASDWCNASYSSSHKSWTAASQLTSVLPKHQLVNSWLEFPCRRSFGARTAEVNRISYAVSLCRGDGNWTNGQALCNSNDWIMQNVEKSRGVECAEHSQDDYIQGLFLFFKWVSGSKQYDWLVEIHHPLEDPAPVEALKVRFRSQYISEAFTDYEVLWTYLLLAITACVGLFYFKGLYKYGLCDEWRYEQGCISVLLVGLIGFNNPLFLTIMSDTTSEDAKEAMQFVHCIFSALFVCGLLFVVLCMLAEMRSRKSHEVSWQLFYIPKAVLMLAMWVTMLGGYISVIASDQGHLTFDGPGDQDQHYVALVLLCIEIAVYLIWVLIAALGAMYSMLSYFPARQFLFVFFVLLTTIVTALGTLISYYFTVSTLQFVMLFGTCNLFVWTLAVCFCPVSVSYTHLTLPTKRIV
eukprot:TRINITY_DN6791_c0_g1_i4.p1 TRINITY_DN6791_c0_g1~~TRINITY_DN6791_c0_g1_i4.p1  ORF type:complete len:467 (-),score=69.46 TRINITY_DN6791_c0_g1_i4:105-1505(-)